MRAKAPKSDIVKFYFSDVRLPPFQAHTVSGRVDVLNYDPTETGVEDVVYAINYDLNKKGQDYSGLHEAIKRLGAWFKVLDSHWLVDTTIGADAIVERIRKHFDNNDRLLVTKVTRDYQGLLTKEDWKWIEARL